MHHLKNNMKQPNFFEAGSPFLQHPLLTVVRTGQEIDFILKQLELPAAARVLDVGCGFGRHSVALAKRGFTVTGIDPAAAMIEAARQRAKVEGVSVDFRQMAAESFMADKEYDTAVCLFTTLGQISVTGENSQLLESVYDGLKAGGTFVVEVPQRDTAVSQLKASDKFGDAERYTAVTRHYDPENQIVTETFKLVAPEKTDTFVLQYRLFSRAELVGLLNQAGFAVTATFADYSGAALTTDSPTMLMLGQK